MRRRALLLLGTAITLAVAGCGTNATATDSSSRAQQTLTVFAAASLQDTFTTLGRRFEATHPGSTVRFSFGGSSGLVTQLEGGAPADVFASADTANMAKATSAGLVSGTPADFASNTLQIAVPPGNPAQISSLADLARPGLKLVVCARAVPCGSAADTVAARAGIGLHPVSEESSVTDVLNKVETGEADAGLVYVTDVKRAGGQVDGVAFCESGAAVNAYPIAVLSGTKSPELAAAFVATVIGPEGRQVLAAAGFGRP